MTVSAPLATETPACLLCGYRDGGIVVGQRGRFNMAVRNVACANCSLVYQTPRPTLEAMAEYYASGYREHYGPVKYPLPNGGAAGPGDAGYAEALELWHSTQAKNAELLGGLKAGERVLEIGCRHARTLRILRDSVGVEVFGIEPGEAEAREAERAGVPCFAGTIENFPIGGRGFDQIQLFHVLEHFHDPLAALLRLRDMLNVGGRLLIEVPNVYQPYGLLEENFFQNAHLTNFSPETLAALLHRAGFIADKVLDRASLFAVAHVDPSAGELPRGYRAEPGAHDAAWVAERLGTYARLEAARTALHVAGPSMELLEVLVGSLKRPGFATHTLHAVSDVVEFFMEHGAKRAAAVVASAAAFGPHPPEIRAACQELASALSASSGAA